MTTPQSSADNTAEPDHDTEPHHDPVYGASDTPSTSRIGQLLRSETVAGVLLLIATVLALIAANAPGLRELYESVSHFHFGPVFGDPENPLLTLDLSVSHWAADALLAVFFFLVGLELKQEFVDGELRNPGKAAVPIAAAFGGVLVPALIFVAFALGGEGEIMSGWAIPTATDIAFATAVLAIVGSHLPVAMRTFLLTLAVVDDLIAITIIALFYTSDLSLGHLGAAIIPIAVFALIAYKGQATFAEKTWLTWLGLFPLGVITWALFYNSGIHATIAGVVLAFMVPVHPDRRTAERDPEAVGLASHLEHLVRPFSAALCVPIFAFFSAGVFVEGWSGLVESWTSVAALGVIVGLLVGKTAGITATTWLLTRLRRFNLDPDIQWIDVLGLAALAGIGFTVSLLISELSFGTSSDLGATSKVGILTGSVLAAVVGGALLGIRNRHYKKVGTPDTASEDTTGPSGSKASAPQS